MISLFDDYIRDPKFGSEAIDGFFWRGRDYCPACGMELLEESFRALRPLSLEDERLVDSDYIPQPFREPDSGPRYGDPCYQCGRMIGVDEAEEELVAEMGAAYLMARAGMESLLVSNHAAYIASWLSALKNDKRLVVVAGSRAQKAAGYILGEAKRERASEKEGAAA